jgi:hypothetical protein
MDKYRDLKAAMHCASAAVGHPAPDGTATSPMVRTRPSARDRRATDDEASDTFIEPWMEVAFHALSHASETGEPFALISCLVNGKPAAIIAATRQRGNGMEVMPLFLAVQPGMTFRLHPDEPPDEPETS